MKIVTKKPAYRVTDTAGFYQSARRDSNPRPRPWQGRAPPLSHSRISYEELFLCFCLLNARTNISKEQNFVNAFLKLNQHLFFRHFLSAHFFHIFYETGTPAVHTQGGM